MRQKLGIAACLIGTVIIGLALSATGIYLFVKKDMRYDKEITARVTKTRYIGDCIYEYAFSVDNTTYTGSYVVNDMCLTRDRVSIKYNSNNPSHNSATIFGSFPPRKLEGIEVAGCVLLAFGGTAIIVVIIVLSCICYSACCKKHESNVQPSVEGTVHANLKV